MKLGQAPGAGRQLLDFPDSRIGASLKPARARSSETSASRLPRFANRGLIEASTAGQSSTLPPRLPRFANRGLIEARGLFVAPTGVSRLPRFANRGLIEATPTANPRPTPIPLPRFANRGLIEAGRDQRLVDRAHYHFPDSRIGASLKQTLLGIFDLVGRDFPDSRIGASLKPWSGARGS